MQINSSPHFFVNHMFLDYPGEGVIIHDPFVDDSNLDSISFELVNFPTLTGDYPSATDSLICTEGFCALWFKPEKAGKYAITLKLSDWRAGVRLSTITRAIVIDVDSSVLVKTVDQRPETVINIFPNPTSEKLQLSGAGLFQGQPYALSVYNLLGEQVHKQENFRLNEEVDVGTFPAGTYLVYLQSGNERLVRKFVVQR